MKKRIIGLGVVSIILINVFISISNSKGFIDLKFLDNIAYAGGEYPNCIADESTQYPIPEYALYADYGYNVYWPVTYYEYMIFDGETLFPSAYVWAADANAAFNYFPGTIVQPTGRSKNMTLVTCDGAYECCTEYHPTAHRDYSH